MDHVKAATYIRRYEGFSKLPYKLPHGPFNYWLWAQFGKRYQRKCRLVYPARGFNPGGTSRQKGVPLVVETGRRAAICIGGYGL